MAVFSYKALNDKGKNVKGVIDAESARQARQLLKAKGIFPTHLEESKTRKSPGASNLLSFSLSKRKVNSTQLSITTRQFATLVGAGMPLVESLKALGEQTDHTTLREIVAEVRDKVNEGSNLADALKDYPEAFPKLFTNMIASGEASGTLDIVLERLADLLENQAALKRRVVSALTYPVLMLFLCFGVILLLLGYVVPQISSIFEERGAALPLPTKIVIGASDFLQDYWWLLLGMILACVLTLSSYAKTKNGRKKLDSLMLKTPLIGKLQLKIATGRFSRNLGMMLESGIELLTALAIVRNIIGNTLLEEIVDETIVGVREGNNLADELNKSHRFPRLLIHMVAIGERTGQLEHMLNRAASAYETEVEASISGLTSILEPVLIIVLALIVAVILASVLLPMLEMTSLAR